ncbi:MAG: hypothetical protein RQ723_12780 [Desulfuromonadales bacterium]|nr:hypothetical protein [Desulfuromonadales bacterium]
MSVKSTRIGKAFERRIARDLRAAGYEAARNLEEVRSGNSGDVVNDAGLCIQCKSYARRAPWRAAMREALEAARAGEVAVAVTHENNNDTYAHLLWSDLVSLLERTRQ